jgi:hypothetical protein
LAAAQLGFLRFGRGDSAGAMPLLEKVLAGNDAELASRVRGVLQMPQTLRGRAEEPAAPLPAEAKQLAEKSLEKGYLKDALKYLQAAHESDPVDFDVMLKLGWTYNILKDDAEAVRWFNLARRSPDASTAAEASRAFHNLEPSLSRFRTTVWMFPMFSTRWHDAFAYAQAKTELRLPHWFVHPYASVRFVGDSRGAVPLANLGPQYLSERSVILGAGLATTPWRRLTAWFEAGESFRYDSGRATPDYRGGLSYAKGVGAQRGVFAETNDDAIFVSRYSNDTLLYSQNRTGYSFGRTQIYCNWNATVDQLRQYWANFAEAGPGIRFRIGAVIFSVNALRGAYLVNQGNPRRPNFNDLRVGFWYAFSR